MLRIIKFFKCTTCSAINEDWEWQHSTMAKMDSTSYTTRESTYCPNCLEAEYEEIEYKDLPYNFKYLMNKKNIGDTLESLSDQMDVATQTPTTVFNEYGPGE